MRRFFSMIVTVALLLVLAVPSATGAGDVGGPDVLPAESDSGSAEELPGSTETEDSSAAEDVSKGAGPGSIGQNADLHGEFSAVTENEAAGTAETENAAEPESVPREPADGQEGSASAEPGDGLADGSGSEQSVSDGQEILTDAPGSGESGGGTAGRSETGFCVQENVGDDLSLDGVEGEPADTADSETGAQDAASDEPASDGAGQNDADVGEDTAVLSGAQSEAESVGELSFAEECAEDTSADDSEIDLEPDVIVEVPDSGRILINPYELAIVQGGTETREQVVSEPVPMINYSRVPIDVYASGVGSVRSGSTVRFVQAPPEVGASQKELFMYVEFQTLAAVGDSVQWSGACTGAENQLIITEQGSESRPVLSLAAVGNAYSSGAFRFFGAASGAPEEQWIAGDGVNIVLTFSFVPA